MSATATVTGVVEGGSGLSGGSTGFAMTSKVFSNVRKVEFDCINNLLNITQDDLYIRNVDITPATTITATKSGSTYTFTVS